MVDYTTWLQCGSYMTPIGILVVYKFATVDASAGTLSIISTVGDTLALFVAHWYLLLHIISTVPP
jgi:hypothetical protein